MTGSRLPLGETLSSALGPAAVVRRLSSSPRSRVWLVELGGAPAIVKQITGGPGAGERFAREATALRLARRVRPYVVPELLGTDPAARVLVLEYLAEPVNTGEPSGPVTGDWMTGYATALARLHAATGPADAGALPGWTGPSQADARAFADLARSLGATVPAGLTRSLEELVERLSQPAGPMGSVGDVRFLGGVGAAGPTGPVGYALLHGDPCPDNAVPGPEGIRFVDLEQAAFGLGSTELAYLRIGFPTCWCVTSVPGPALREAEAAYRLTWRSLTGTDPGGELADACAGWLIRGDGLVERARRGQPDQFARLTRQDWDWGTASARQRLLHRLTAVAALGAEHPGLAGLSQVSAAMRDRILKRWPRLQPLPVTRGNPLG